MTIINTSTPIKLKETEYKMERRENTPQALHFERAADIFSALCNLHRAEKNPEPWPWALKSFLGSGEGVGEPLELELGMIMNCHVGVKNCT